MLEQLSKSKISITVILHFVAVDFLFSDAVVGVVFLHQVLHGEGVVLLSCAELLALQIGVETVGIASKDVEVTEGLQSILT